MRVKRKIMIRIIVLFIVLIGILLGVAIKTPISSISVQGNTYYTREEIIRLLPYNEDSSVFDVMLNRVELIEDQGYISRMEIRYPDLTNINIHIYEKEIIGYVEYLGKYLCIDNNGYIVDYTNKPKEQPIVKGIDVSEFTVYEPLDVDKSIVDAVYTIYRNMEAFDIPITSVDFSYGKDTEITLQCEKLAIYIGDVSRIEEKFQLMREIINTLPEGEQGILSIENVDQNIIFKSSNTIS
jgi:cell division protein FtsQ